ncbi:XLF-domain-containing protein [Byssothecium circinans]|uniref:Non-homologous end-joining factor 1 n=1 Tax=Byssothecium circinans TaxID=147558 RepID=A0A6A5TJQ7_9PLEO|nr:XLF-domain-containing protein [Byssothecium circinans]
MSCWRVLELSDQPNAEKIPQLLVKPRFGSDAYSIFLTDLSNIWSEELDVDSIVERASAEESPIEVSKQDTTQLAILLENVQKSLAGNDDTSCRMTRTDADDIILHTTISLPEPLDSLRWKFHMRKRGPVILKNELILPLLVSSHIQHERINSLIHTISAKDRAITRLVDQFESSNQDLRAAFPSIVGTKSGRRAVVKREQAAKHVPGLQEFDEESWKSSTAELHNTDVSTLGLFQEALSECTPKVPPRLQSDNEHDTWWTAIGSSLPTSKPIKSKAKAASKEPEPPKPTAADSETDDDETEDEFETHENFKLRNKSQTTHVPVPTSTPTEKHTSVHGDDTTDEDDDDLDAPPKSQSQLQAPLRRTKSPTPQPTPSKEKTPPLQKPKSKGFRIGGKTKKSETPPPAEEEAEPSSVNEDVPIRPKVDRLDLPATAKPVKKSFKIGGKMKAAVGGGAKEPTPPAEEGGASAAVKSAPTKAVAPAAQDEDVQMEDVEETAEEKAERKRRELKRKNEELARKQAQSKKKRRF